MNRRLKYIIFAFAVAACFTPPSHGEEITRADSLLKAKKHFSFAVQYKKGGSFKQALENYRQSIAYNDTVYQVHYSFADLLMKMDRIDEAKREYAISLRLNPKHYNSASMLAKLHYESAHYDSALTTYEIMYGLKPDDVGLLTTIAGLREYLGKDAEALEAYKTIAAAGGDNGETLMKAVSLAVKMKDWEEAERLVEPILERRPGDRDALNIAATVSTERNDLASAVQYLRILAATDTSDVAALEKLETTAELNGDIENRLWAMERLHALSPGDVSLIGDLAELLFREKKDERGLPYLRKGIELAPRDGRLRILMGDYYRKRNENDKAVAEYTIALDDEKWKNSAQQFIWLIEPPKTDAEKAEQEFFNRGRQKRN